MLVVLQTAQGLEARVEERVAVVLRGAVEQRHEGLDPLLRVVPKNLRYPPLDRGLKHQQRLPQRPGWDFDDRSGKDLAPPSGRPPSVRSVRRP
jgi:hypothetical protein